MLQQRLSKFVKRPQNLDIRDRHPVLRNLEGWFNVSACLEDKYNDLISEYEKSGSRLKFTRWLANVKKLDNTVISEIGKQLVSVTVKFSCRHNDLLRLGDTRHYKSCMKSPSLGKQQLLYLADPDVAMLFVPDKAGKFVWRCLIRLAYNNLGDLVLVAYKVYGNGPTDAILRALSKKANMPVHKSVCIREQDRTHVYFVSPTIHNNRIVQKPIWTDHIVGMTNKGRIFIEVDPSPVV